MLAHAVALAQQPANVSLSFFKFTRTAGAVGGRRPEFIADANVLRATFAVAAALVRTGPEGRPDQEQQEPPQHLKKYWNNEP